MANKLVQPQIKKEDGTFDNLIFPASAVSGLDDLATIKSGAALGATAVQPEEGKGLFSGSYNDLTDKPTIPDISNMVTTDTTQTISGEKTFSGTVKFNNSATPTITITKNGSTSLLHTTIGYDGLALKDGTNKYLKMESGDSFSSNFGYKINKGDGVAHYISIPADDGTVALTKDIPDVTGMLTTSNYATTLGNVYQAKGDYVTAEAGKGLSTNDYTTEDQTFITNFKKIADLSDMKEISIMAEAEDTKGGTSGGGGQVTIGGKCADFYSYLTLISDGDGWEFCSKAANNNNFLKVSTEAKALTKNTTYSFKEDGLYLNNSKVTFSGSYNDLTNKPTLFSGSYNDLTDKPTIPDVSSKLDKITDQTAAAIVYAASKSGDTVTQTSYQLTSNATGSTAMFRDGNGRTKVATPVNDTEAANKRYVDGKVGSYKITSYTVDEEKITLTVEAV